MIRGFGSNSPRIMFIGDFASNDDLKTEYAFSGSIGKTMRDLCNRAELKFEQNYATLYIKDKMEGFKFAGIKRKRELLIEARKKIQPLSYDNILLEEIKALEPNLIVPCGELTLNYLTGVRGLRKFRGSILETTEKLSEYLGRTYKVIPTLHPWDIYEDQKFYFIAMVDYIYKIAPQSQYKEMPNDNSILWVGKTSEELNNYIKRQLPNSKFVTFDIETCFGFPTCISFCFDGTESASFPLLHPDIPEAEMAFIWHYVARLLNNPIPKVNQNIKYDATIMERFSFNVRNIAGDTALRFHILYPEFDKNLGFQNSIYTQIPYFKDEGKGSLGFPPDDRHMIYNAKDALVTHKIYTKQESELDEKNLRYFHDKRIWPLFFTYRKMGDRGIRVDDTQRRSLLGKYTSIFGVHEKTLQLSIDTNFNPLSSVQVGKLVYEDLKFPIRRKKNNDTGRPGWNTEEETLEELLTFDASSNAAGPRGVELIRSIIACRKLHKVIEYLESPLWPDGRMRCDWNLNGTNSGRTSAGKTLDYSLLRNGDSKFKLVQLGRSLQTIGKHGFKIGNETYGKDLRTIFVPSHNMVFVECDQSQAEARHVAVLSMDWETLSILEKTNFEKNQYGVKDDLHTITASWVLGKDWHEVTEENRQEEGKHTRHGGAYGMSPKRFAMMYHVLEKRAAEVLSKFHKVSPKIQQVFWRGVGEYVRNNRYLVNPFGRRRDFFSKIDEESIKEAYAYIPQGAVSDHQKFAMGRVDDSFTGFYFLVEAHDSTLSEMSKDIVEKYCEVFKREIEVPINYKDCSLSRDYELVVPAEFTWGDTNWGDMKKL
jgi:DNA polymerase I-like protein with 3'-5' exonuclease and polymerase domains/uracil-DNA glycosylase